MRDDCLDYERVFFVRCSSCVTTCVYFLQTTCEVLNAAAAVGSTPTGSISGVRFSEGLEVLGRVCSNPASTNNGNMSDNKTHGAGDEVPSLALSQRSDALIGALCTAFVGYELQL